MARRELPRVPPVITTGRAADTLRKWGFTAATGLDHWSFWDTVRGDERLRITAVPGQHGPAGVHRLLPPVIGTVLDLERRDLERRDLERRDGAGWRRALRVYITGDTLNVPRLREVTERFPDVDVMLTHLGGTRVLGLLVTMDGRQGTDLVDRVRPRAVVPIHYGDYGVFKSPLADFVDEMGRRGHAALLRSVGRGRTVDLFPDPHPRVAARHGHRSRTSTPRPNRSATRSTRRPPHRSSTTWRRCARPRTTAPAASSGSPPRRPCSAPGRRRPG